MPQSTRTHARFEVKMKTITGEEAGLGLAYKGMTFTEEVLQVQLAMRDARRREGIEESLRKRKEKYRNDDQYRHKLLAKQKERNEEDARRRS